MNCSVFPEPQVADAEAAEISAWCAALEGLARHSECCVPMRAGLAPYFKGSDALTALARADAVPLLPAPVRRPAGRFVLPRVHVVNPGRPTEVADLWLEDGAIAALQPPGSPTAPGFQTLQACVGRWVMPGLIDMHAHLPADNVLKLTPHFMRMFVAHGVTGIREAGDVDGTALGAARRWRSQPRPVAPRIAAAHFFVGRPPFRWKNVLAYRSAEDAPQIMARLAAVGARCIKLYENLKAEDIDVLQRHAERAGLIAMGHVPTGLTLEQAGLHDAQHFFGVPPPASLRRDHVFSRTADWQAVDDKRLDEVAAFCERHGLANTPTLTINQGLLGYRDFDVARRQLQGRMPSFFGDVVWHPGLGLPAYRGLQNHDLDALAEAFEKKKRLVRELHARGCAVFPGTDTLQPFCLPGWSMHQELEVFVQAGLTAAQALKTATVDAAARLGWHDSGRVDVGCRADLLVMAQDPTADLSALRSIEQVVLQGEVHDATVLRAEIAADLQRREGAFQRVATRVLARLAMRRAARHFKG